MDGDDSYGAAVESIANKEWERNAKPRRGVPGGLPPGKAGEAPVGRRSVCPNQLCLRRALRKIFHWDSLLMSSYVEASMYVSLQVPTYSHVFITPA